MLIKNKKEEINSSGNDLIEGGLNLFLQFGTLFSSDEIVAGEVNESNKSNDFHYTIEHRDAVNNCNNFMKKKLCNNHDKKNSSGETNVLEKFIRNVLIHEGFDLCDLVLHL